MTFEPRPPRDNWPLPCPLAAHNPAPPPFTRLPLQDPLYVPSLPDFVDGQTAVDDTGWVVPKYDGVVVRGTQVVNGRVEIPPGGLTYLADTLRSTLPAVGGFEFILGHSYYFVDNTMELVVAEQVELRPGQSAVVGDVEYVLGAAPSYQALFRNVVVHAYSVTGIDWDFAGMSPVSLPMNEDNWYSNEFALAFVQGRAHSVRPDRVEFETLTALHMAKQLLAAERPYFGPLVDGMRLDVGAGELIARQEGDSWQLMFQGPGEEVRGRFSPPWPLEQLPEGQEARRSLQLRWSDGVAELVPQGSEMRIRVYRGLMELVSGEPYPHDPSFLVRNVACPIGHGWSIALYNPTAFSLGPGESCQGPDGYFRLVVDEVEGDEVKWHFEDRAGHRCLPLAKAGNVDTLLGGGRAVQHLLGRGGVAPLRAMYRWAESLAKDQVT